MIATVISKKDPRENEYLSEILLNIDNGKNFWDVTIFENVIKE